MKYLLWPLAAIGVTLLVLNAPSKPPSTATQQPVDQARAARRIPIDPRRWYQVVNASTGLAGLFDGVLQENVNTGWSKLLPNYDAYYPLRPGETMRIDSIRLYDFADQNLDKPMTLSVITDTWQRVPIARFVGASYNEWVGPDPAHPAVFALKNPVANARYLVINTWGAYPAEMELYGAYTPGKDPMTTPVPVRKTPFAQAVGVNMFEWNLEEAARSWEIDESRVPAVKGFAAVRHYMDWDKLEGEPGQYTYNLTLHGAWNYDALYTRLKAEHVMVLACLKTIPKWMENLYPAGQRDYGNNPVRYGSDLTKPASYVEQARVAFQYMARYGFNKKIDPSLVKISTVKTWAPMNEKKIGLGLIRFIECENERDKTWKGRDGYQTAREYAANLSAFYDGHKGALGLNAGVKTADPGVTVVIGGLAAATTDYVRAMVDWCREFRGYRPDGRVDLCWDVINQHLYANDAHNSQGMVVGDKKATRGAAPEVSGVGLQAREFVKLSHELAYDMPVWITEAGYDTNPGSPFHAIAIGPKSVLDTQADWTLRTALLYLRMGIDRVFFYQLYDENPADGTQFSSMGLINGNKTRKPAADYLHQARQLIGSYAYQQTIATDPLVDRYEQAGKQAFVLTIPDERGRTATYHLSIPKGDTVRVCVPRAGRESMPCSLQISRLGSIPVFVSETPTFVLHKPRNILPVSPSKKSE
ncbi:hypothetical protein J2I47_03260 [Fibrella sp. HMF5335]|uniref:Glycoside hydrolase family 42 N-terminal domain-containing protein n=1 Tax=Fibrella rubiginis TaxID=2817060 RepID=A0A939K1S5_9BACT|nr:hypothetical protein [Fibrella rubiginis]MBO0935559.1 hypothetical protein [Fibrella rubiginis]